MMRPASSTKRAATSRAQEIMFLQNRLALIRKLERMLKQRSTSVRPPGRKFPGWCPKLRNSLAGTTRLHGPSMGPKHPAFAR
jgi:hypothetical protein